MSKLYELTLGYSCNANCQFCSVEHDRTINKTTLEAMYDMRMARKEGFDILGLGGGEPTIRKDIYILLNFAKQLGFKTIRIQSNAIMLRYKSVCEKLVASGATFFKLSVHSHKPEIHDALTRVKGAFKHVCTAIDNLHALDSRIEMNIVLNKLNYKLLPQYIDFFHKKGVYSFCVIYPLLTGRMALNNKKIGIRIKDVLPYVKQALDLAKTLSLDKCIIFNIPYCLLNGYESHVVSSYNMKLNTPVNIVQNVDEDVVTVKTAVPLCKKCKHTSRCKGVWNHYIKYYGKKEFQSKKK